LLYDNSFINTPKVVTQTSGQIFANETSIDTGAVGLATTNLPNEIFNDIISSSLGNIWHFTKFEYTSFNSVFRENYFQATNQAMNKHIDADNLPTELNMLSSEHIIIYPYTQSTPVLMANPRNLLLAKRSIETGGLFVLLKESSSIGTVVRIKKAQYTSEGYLEIVLEGLQRVQVLETKVIDDHFGLRSAEIKYLEDTDADTEKATNLRQELEIFITAIYATSQFSLDIPRDNGQFIWWVADLLPAPNYLKQTWLESGTYCERIINIIGWVKQLYSTQRRYSLLNDVIQ